MVSYTASDRQSAFISDLPSEGTPADISAVRVEFFDQLLHLIVYITLKV
jgi:hypothetical protein